MEINDTEYSSYLCDTYAITVKDNIELCMVCMTDETEDGKYGIDLHENVVIYFILDDLDNGVIKKVISIARFVVL